MTEKNRDLSCCSSSETHYHKTTTQMSSYDQIGFKHENTTIVEEASENEEDETVNSS